MNSAKYDVLGIGNALDILVRVDDKFLTDHCMTKGSMALIDEARAASIYSDMYPATEVSGGFGGQHHRRRRRVGARTAYVGKIKDDQIGQLYAHDIRAAGVAFTAAATEGPATGCSYILVTPDGERTMNDLSRARRRTAGRRYRRRGDREGFRTGLSWGRYLRNPKDAMTRSSRPRRSRTSTGARRFIRQLMAASRYRDEFNDRPDAHANDVDPPDLLPTEANRGFFRFRISERFLTRSALRMRQT